MLDKRAWLWRNDDGLRRMLNFEPRGSGKSTFLRALLGEHPIMSGELRLGGSIQPGYYRQGLKNLADLEAAKPEQAELELLGQMDDAEAS